MTDNFTQPITFGGEISAAPHNDAWDALETYLNARFGNLTAGHILVANGSGVVTGVAMSGDGTISTSGVFSIAAGAVGTPELADDAVTAPKIAPGAIGPAEIGVLEVFVGHSAGQTIPDATSTNLDWTEDLDPAGMHAGTSPTVTLTRGGVWAASLAATFAANNTGRRQLGVGVGGVGIWASPGPEKEFNPDNSQATVLTISGLLIVDGPGAVSGSVFQNKGGNMTVSGSLALSYLGKYV